jgi:hypothetical protein
LTDSVYKEILIELKQYDVCKAQYASEVALNEHLSLMLDIRATINSVDLARLEVLKQQYLTAQSLNHECSFLNEQLMRENERIKKREGWIVKVGGVLIIILALL